MFNNRRSANRGKSLVHQILFSNAKSVVPVKIQGEPGIEITTQGGDQLSLPAPVIATMNYWDIVHCCIKFQTMLFLKCQNVV